MNKTILQIPIDKSLRDRAAAASAKLGFSSLQESVRLYLHKLSENKLDVMFKEPDVQLSPRAIRRYNKLITDIESGKEPVYTASSVKDLLDQLYGRKPPVRKKVS